MFETSVLETRSGKRLQWIVAGSVVVQTALVGWMVIFPLLWPAVLPPSIAKAEIKRLTFHKPKIVQVVQKVVAIQTSSLHAPAATAAQVVAPRGPVIERLTPTISNDEPTYQVVGSTMGGPTGPNLFRTLDGNGDGRSRTVTVKPSGPSTPLRISGGVSSGLLLAPIRPQYPPIAKSAGVSGTVVVAARIGTDGRIQGAQVISGPLMLQSAALEAVKEARYRPYLLNGQPVEVETSFAVNFVMGGA
jgi:protein TonB